MEVDNVELTGNSLHLRYMADDKCCNVWNSSSSNDKYNFFIYML